MNKKITPSYINSKGVLFQEDCLNVLSEIRSDSIDCIFADPPFNLNKKYNGSTYNDKRREDEYLEWLNKCLDEFCRVLRPGGSLFIYHMPIYLIKLSTHLNSFHSNDMAFRHWIALNMKNGFPIKNRLHPAHYGLLYYVKKGADFTFNVVRTQSPKCRHCDKEVKDYGGYKKKFDKWRDDDAIWIQISDFWDDTRPERHKKNRPNQVNELPYEIPERVILLSTNPGDIVYDPFTGGGSTLYAACINKRFWIGTEIGDIDSIIELLSSCKVNIATKIPSKIHKVLVETDKIVDSLTVESRAHVSTIISSLDKTSDIQKPGNRNRYSHRMTNKVFD